MLTIIFGLALIGLSVAGAIGAAQNVSVFPGALVYHLVVAAQVIVCLGLGLYLLRSGLRSRSR